MKLMNSGRIIVNVVVHSKKTRCECQFILKRK